MIRRLLANISSSNNNSVIYLALLCLLYLFITSNFIPAHSTSQFSSNTEIIYVEVSEDGISTVKSFLDPLGLKELKDKYSLLKSPEHGDRIIIDEHGTTVAKISGRKRISLGIPIGINSATNEDLKAIPGIGEELAMRIINYRDANEEFKSIDELDDIEGIGSIKLETIKDLTNVD